MAVSALPDNNDIWLLFWMQPSRKILFNIVELAVGVESSKVYPVIGLSIGLDRVVATDRKDSP